MIKVEKLYVSYEKESNDIISDMSFEIEKGCILNILGQNAVGKTTLIRTLMREIPRYRGSIKIDGQNIDNFTVQEYAKKVGVVSTSYNTFQNLLVADYLATGFINQMTPFAKPNNEYIKKAYDVLNSFEKQNLFNKRINQLSSGERQIVMIARTLLQNPKIIIFDEPTANLDVKNQITILNQIKKLSQRGYTIIITTHNPGHALSMRGKTLIMGIRKYCFGDTENVINEKALSEFYNLDVSMCDIDEKKCIVFKNHDVENGDIKIIL